MKHMLPFMLLFFVASCNHQQPTEQQHVEQKDDMSPRLEKLYAHFQLEKDNNLKREVAQLQRNHKYLQFAAKTEIGNLYVSTATELSTIPDEVEYRTIYKNQNFGLLDNAGKVLLKNEYQQIGNPGAIASGYVEIKRDGKYGLYDYVNKVLTAPQFDVIFPTGFVSFAAVGKKLDKYYKIYADGSIREITDPKQVPTYQTLGDKRNFDLTDRRIALYTYIPEAMEYESYGVLFSPSYQVKLGVIPPIINNILLSDEAEYGVVGARSKPIQQRKNEKGSSFIEQFEKEVQGTRNDLAESRYQLINLGKNSAIKDSKTIAKNYHNGFYCKEEKKDQLLKITYLNDTLTEVKNDVRKRNFLNYDEGTCYSYFSISSSGIIKALHPKSIFPMSSIIQLNENYLKGTFYNNLTDEEEYEDDGDGNTEITSFLTAEDLAYMRNEIFARHGYIFKDPKWKAIFMPFDWYKPIHPTIDKLLTPIEKKNLIFLEKWENTLNINADQYLQKKRYTCGYAG